MKQILFSDDKTVTKVIHNDGSETAIKTISSCDTVLNDADEFELSETDRNKYSIFISSSAGCYMKCNFCYLTLKDMKHRKIEMLDLCDNVTEAIDNRIKATYTDNFEPIHNKYVKLCWMGMGDAFIKTRHVVEATARILNSIFVKHQALGIDGVDLSTVMPKVQNVKQSFDILKHLNDKILLRYDINPHNNILVHRNSEFGNMGKTYPNRSRFRLFYSLHSAVQETRDTLIPNAMPIKEAIPALIDYSENNKNNVIFHHMFIDGFNDTEKEVDALIALIEEYDLYDYEFRILRYNTCEVSTFMHESDNFKNIIKRLMSVHDHVKVQVSAGSEVKAACGQFLAGDLL